MDEEIGLHGNGLHEVHSFILAHGIHSKGFRRPTSRCQSRVLTPFSNEFHFTVATLRDKFVAHGFIRGLAFDVRSQSQ